MGMFDSPSGSDANDAINAIQQAYDEAVQWMSPYTQYAEQDFDTGRNAVYKGFDYLAQRPHYAQGFSQLLGMTPADILNQAESGYKMNVGTRDQMKIANSAIQNAAEAAGTAGGGENLAETAEIMTAIYGQGMDEYLNQLNSLFNTQLRMLHSYEKPVGDLTGLFQDMIGREYGASSLLANSAMREGQMESNAYGRQEASDRGRASVGQTIAGVGAGAISAL